MIEQGHVAGKKISELLSWEKTKRRERVLTSALCYSILASFLILPVKELMSLAFSPVSLPLLFFLIFTPLFFLRRPWGHRESLRTLLLLDRTLNLKEMALTSWEILKRQERKAVELLVVEEAEKKLGWIDPRALFKRQYSWQAISVLPLLLLWLVFIWLDDGIHFHHGVERSQPISVARKLKEFSRELQERAKAQGLTESLKMARALEELAEKNLKGELSEKRLSEDLAAMAGKIEEMAPAPRRESGLSFPATLREDLLDLKAEMEAFKLSHPFPGAAGQEGKLEPELVGRLAALPRLSEEIEKRFSPIEKLDRKDLSRFLDQLEKDVGAEMDRFTLLEMRDFLGQILQGAEGTEVAGALRQAGKDEAGKLSGRDKVREKGGQPGNQPGTREQTAQTLSPFQARAGTHLKGLLGEGKSRSLSLSTESPGRRSGVAQEEVFASYRRRAEEELASEQIPAGLKETIKRYFLSLGMTEEKKKE